MELSASLVWFGVLQTLIYLLFIRTIDLYEREPLRYVLAVFIWGFAVATTISLVFNTLAEITFDVLVSRQEANFLTAVFVLCGYAAANSRAAAVASVSTLPWLDSCWLSGSDILASCWAVGCWATTSRA